MNDVETVEVGGYSQCARAVADGRAGFTYNAPISTVIVEIEQNPHGIKYIPMELDNEAGWKKFWAVRSDTRT